MADIPDNILTGCRNNNSKAQEELYRLVAPRMYVVCLRYANSQEEAKDILQEGFVKVFQKIGQYEGKGSLEGWIRKIMVNTALANLRKQKILINLDEKEGKQIEPHYNDIIENLNAEDLLKLISELSPVYRTVFNLYVIEGYNHREISEKLGISEGSSKSNLSRARVVLQEKVNRLYGTKNEYGE